MKSAIKLDFVDPGLKERRKNSQTQKCFVSIIKLFVRLNSLICVFIEASVVLATVGWEILKLHISSACRNLKSLLILKTNKKLRQANKKNSN